ncbi:L-2-hydroxyglutarate oxidase [Thermasporomyces composti]|jgi:L-2-hydroxyglutarate oxidase|uniref:L-2-hydroxyglutarate oxidase n=1 Tax=Thermasporomyces composti TaxID=696763 RepID=A0A3D9V319_THECX|nr:L-2-hydroxyglutarate oxidase [Thermasporomyces composti]REF36202.1 L-2-hydroxyglutarate oxidase [Thermasporomyces composti]
MTYDYVVVGGGIVGLSTARHLLTRRPGAGVVVLEKEDDLGVHQTGHNSGVIHAGIYYAPGSLKARLCRAGERATKEFCTEHDIPFRTVGKLVVATTDLEVRRLRELRGRAEANGVVVEPVDATRLREMEPHVSGLEALLVPATGIVDFRLVALAMAEDIREAGGEIHTGVTVTGIEEGSDVVRVHTSRGAYRGRRLVACAGLQADRVARMGGLTPDFRIVPFRGEYYELPPERAGLVNHLIYPVPDPELPFLGVHLSPTIDGRITVGPNAVLGWAREGYRKGSFSWQDVSDYLRFPGFWRFARANLRVGVRETLNSAFKRGYLAQCRTYCPELRLADLRPHEAGIRAQAILADGTPVHDFLFRQTSRQVHVANAPSPAATSALPIGELIAERVL